RPRPVRPSCRWPAPASRQTYSRLLRSHSVAGTLGRVVGEPVVGLEHVRRSFGDVVALADLSFAAPKGSVTVLLGPNGSGKTTAVRTITGALRPDAGTVEVFGIDPDVDGESVRTCCGVVSAKPALYDRLTGRDNLRYAAGLWWIGLVAPIYESAARFGLTDD